MTWKGLVAIRILWFFKGLDHFAVNARKPFLARTIHFNQNKSAKYCIVWVPKLIRKAEQRSLVDLLTRFRGVNQMLSHRPWQAWYQGFDKISLHLSLLKLRRCSLPKHCFPSVIAFQDSVPNIVASSPDMFTSIPKSWLVLKLEVWCITHAECTFYINQNAFNVSRVRLRIETWSTNSGTWRRCSSAAAASTSCSIWRLAKHK